MASTVVRAAKASSSEQCAKIWRTHVGTVKTVWWTRDRGTAASTAATRSAWLWAWREKVSKQEPAHLEHHPFSTPSAHDPWEWGNFWHLSHSVWGWMDKVVYFLPKCYLIWDDTTSKRKANLTPRGCCVLCLENVIKHHQRPSQISKRISSIVSHSCEHILSCLQDSFCCYTSEVLGNWDSVLSISCTWRLWQSFIT